MELKFFIQQTGCCQPPALHTIPNELFSSFANASSRFGGVEGL